MANEHEHEQEHDEQKPSPREATSTDEAPLRHKGEERTTPEERSAGPQPEGNGGTGKPAAFPPHN